MKGRTRVLVWIRSLGLGGTEINAVQFAAAVREHGYDCTLAAPAETASSGPGLRDVAAQYGLAIEPIPNAGSTLAEGRLLDGLAERTGARIVHAYGAWQCRSSYWGPCRFGKRALVKTVYEMKVNPETCRYGPELIVGAPYLVDEINGRKGGVHLISPPVDLARDYPDEAAAGAFLFQHGLTPERLRVVIVSRLAQDMKALPVELAMRAVESSGGRDFDLVVVGGGDAEVRLNAMAQAINARCRRRAVHMLGPLADPRPAYACADIVIGMGSSAARALAFGKPLIASGEFGWFKVFDAETAPMLFRDCFWSPTASPDPLAELLDAVHRLSSPAQREALGRYGRQFAERRYGLEAMGERLATVYRRASDTYDLSRWWCDLPLELALVRRRLQGRRGYLPLDLHVPGSARSDSV